MPAVASGDPIFQGSNCGTIWQALNMHVQMVDRVKWGYMKAKPTGTLKCHYVGRARNSPTRCDGNLEVVQNAVTYRNHAPNY